MAFAVRILLWPNCLDFYFYSVMAIVQLSMTFLWHRSELISSDFLYVIWLTKCSSWFLCFS